MKCRNDTKLVLKCNFKSVSDVLGSKVDRNIQPVRIIFTAVLEQMKSEASRHLSRLEILVGRSVIS